MRGRDRSHHHRDITPRQSADFSREVLASKYRDSTESSFLLNAIKLPLASVVFSSRTNLGWRRAAANAALLLSGARLLSAMFPIFPPI